MFNNAFEGTARIHVTSLDLRLYETAFGRKARTRSHTPNKHAFRHTENMPVEHKCNHNETGAQDLFSLEKLSMLRVLASVQGNPAIVKCAGGITCSA